jgi:signal transduction histidine kinase
MTKLRPICSVCKVREQTNTTTPPVPERTQVDDNHKTQICQTYAASLANAEAAVANLKNALIILMATKPDSKAPVETQTTSPPVQAKEEPMASGLNLSALLNNSMAKSIEAKGTVPTRFAEKLRVYSAKKVEEAYTRAKEGAMAREKQLVQMKALLNKQKARKEAAAREEKPRALFESKAKEARVKVEEETAAKEERLRICREKYGHGST